MEDSICKKMSASGIVHDGPCWLTDFLLGTDGVNNPTITIYDGVSTGGEEIVPTSPYEATVLGVNGFTFPVKRRCISGIYIEISTAGSCEVIVGYKPSN